MQRGTLNRHKVVGEDMTHKLPIFRVGTEDIPDRHEYIWNWCGRHRCSQGWGWAVLCFGRERVKWSVV